MSADLQAESSRGSHRGDLPIAVVAAVGASLLGIVIAPYAGRAGAALVGAVVVAIVGMYRGLPAACVAAVIVFLAYSVFIGERRLPGDFLFSRHLPQLIPFLLVALIAGSMASQLKAEISAKEQLERSLKAVADTSRRLTPARDLAESMQAVRSSGLDVDLRLFCVVADRLEELEPLPLDDAGRAFEAAEIAWRTGCQMHRMSGIAACTIANGGKTVAVLVASRRGTGRVPVLPVEILAAMLSQRITSSHRLRNAGE